MREEALGQGNAVGDCRHERIRWELRAVPRETEEQTRGRQRGNKGRSLERRGGEDTRAGTDKKGYASPTQMVGLAQRQISK